MADTFSVSMGEPGKLKVSRIQKEVKVGLVLQLGVIGLWYWMVTSPSNDTVDVFDIIFLVLPLSIVPGIFKSLKQLIKGERWLFDRGKSEILFNGEHRASFSEIALVQIRTFQDLQGTAGYRVSLVSRDDTKHYIGTTQSREGAEGLAKEISNFMEIEIIQKV